MLSSTIVELSTIELDRVTGGATILPSPTPPPGGGVPGQPPPPGGGNQSPPPTGVGLASLGSDFSKLFTDLKDGASLSTIRADYRAILHDAGVGAF